MPGLGCAAHAGEEMCEYGEAGAHRGPTGCFAALPARYDAASRPSAGLVRSTASPTLEFRRRSRDVGLL